MITTLFRCPASTGVCATCRGRAMVVSGGKLRPATEEEVSELGVRDVVAWEPIRLPGLGTEGLAQFLSEGGAPDVTTAEGFLITRTYGHLFLDELPGP